MELWEKEYLKIIEEENQRREEREAEAVRKHVKQTRESVWSGGIKLAGKILAALILAFCAFVFLMIAPSLKGSFSNLSDSGIVSNLFGNRFASTYVNGSGFNRMMTFLEEWDKCSHELVNDLVAKSLVLSEEERTQWDEKLTAFEEKFDALVYDDSYEELVSAHRQILRLEQELLAQIKNGESFNVMKETYNHMAEISSSLRGILIDAFDANGIQYQIVDGMIRYSYRMD